MVPRILRRRSLDPLRNHRSHRRCRRAKARLLRRHSTLQAIPRPQQRRRCRHRRQVRGRRARERPPQRRRYRGGGRQRYDLAAAPARAGDIARREREVLSGGDLHVDGTGAHCGESVSEVAALYHGNPRILPARGPPALPKPRRLQRQTPPSPRLLHRRSILPPNDGRGAQVPERPHQRRVRRRKDGNHQDRHALPHHAGQLPLGGRRRGGGRGRSEAEHHGARPAVQPHP
mmetsp:Transcript_21539/g.52045  ORF Transcript_21539/g.52045 Transcript_21539/m.52045 type:complete len:231 (-) Transcript_21539:4183-4875(-)